MEALLNILKNVLIFIALAMPGYVLVKTKLLKTAESGALSKLLTYVGMPFLILSSTINIEFTAEFTLTTVITALVGIIITVLIVLLSAPITTRNKNKDDVKSSKMRGIMRFAMAFSNNGFLGIPLAMAVFPDKPLVVSIVVILNIITNIGIYTLGIYLISGDKSMMSAKKALFNPVLIAFILGLILNLIGANKVIPEIAEYSAHLKNIVTPVSMIILGMKMADIKLSSIFTSVSNYYVSAIKLIALPIIATAIAFALTKIFNISTDLVLAFFVAFAMPTAGLASTLADNYGGDTENAVIYTLGTTVLSIITIPLLYMLVTLIV
ncbi:MAG: AEC family transporter [Clostridia bacterium]|nr:AEC family transporter [Clostridia bacterium]